MYKFLVLALILTIFCGVIYIKNFSYETPSIGPAGLQKIEENIPLKSFKIDHSKDFILVLLPKNIQIEFIDQSKTEEKKATSDILKEKNLDFLINGGFFLENFSHAGLLAKYGNVEVQIATLDKQVRGILTMYENSIEINNIDNYHLRNSYVEFQTGPIILRNNIKQQNDINLSVNGNSKHLRSIIGKTNENQIFLFASRKFMTLNEVSDKLVKHKFFANMSIDAINLDGGNSVSLVYDDNKVGGTGLQKRLPFYIGFRLI